MLFGGLLAAALLLVSEHRLLVTGAWVVSALGCVGARLVGSLLPRTDQAIHRALLESLIRPALPLVVCVAVSFRLPADDARTFALSLIAFFLIMLAMDRLMFVANLPDNQPLVS